MQKEYINSLEEKIIARCTQTQKQTICQVHQLTHRKYNSDKTSLYHRYNFILQTSTQGSEYPSPPPHFSWAMERNEDEPRNRPVKKRYEND